ncbi:hypothetical protein AC1031_013995 [Aphanomyces cochlioides]|nr:hypothetical protein AC1031_013995 [Aphanomyces cochlioides]
MFKSKTEKAYLDATDIELTAMLLEAASSPALQDNPAVVRSLLTHGANVNSTDNHGNTPLYWASLRGHLGTVKELLFSGARVDISNHEDKTALYWASARGNLEIVKILLEQKAKASIVNENGQTPLFRAIVQGHFDIVVALMEASDPSANKANYEDATPLHEASKQGKLDIVKLLLDHGTHVDSKDKDGFTALEWASYHGYYEIVKILLHHGASVNTIDKDGKTPLMWATRFNYDEIVNELLTHGASVNLAGRNGYTALHWATRFGHVDIVKNLLAHRSFVGVADMHGWTPLHLSSKDGHLDIVSLLLDAGAETLAKTKDGRTARGLGNDDIKAAIDDFELPISIERAIERIRQVLENADKSKSEIVVVGSAILSQCLQFQFHQENILTTALMVERILRHILRCGPPDEASTLIAVLKVMESHFKNILETIDPSQLQMEDILGQGKVQLIGSEIVRLQVRLVAAAENLHINLNDHVVGTVYDLQSILGRTMNVMGNLDKDLKVIADLPKEDQKDEHKNLLMQIKESLKLYDRQVALGNITYDENFVIQCESCQQRIGEAIMQQQLKTLT